MVHSVPANPAPTGQCTGGLGPLCAERLLCVSPAQKHIQDLAQRERIAGAVEGGALIYGTVQPRIVCFVVRLSRSNFRRKRPMLQYRSLQIDFTHHPGLSVVSITMPKSCSHSPSQRCAYQICSLSSVSPRNVCLASFTGSPAKDARVGIQQASCISWSRVLTRCTSPSVVGYCDLSEVPTTKTHLVLLRSRRKVLSETVATLFAL